MAGDGTGAHGSVIASQLSVSSPKPYEVQNTLQHRQYINYQHSRLQLFISNVSSESVKFVANKHGHSCQIPIDAWLRTQLDTVEQFVQNKVDLSCLDPPPKIVSYKPLWRGNQMFIHLAPWCNILKQTLLEGFFETVGPTAEFGPGRFHISLELSHIFIGPHKNGEHYSLSMSIVQMVFHPEQPTLLPIKPKPTEKKGRARKDKQHVTPSEETST